MNSGGPRTEMPETDQLAEILSAYTELTERLQTSHARLTDEVARLRGELANKNRQLQRRNRLAALGEMAAGIAHEIRNPLGGIALYAGLLSKQLGDRPKAQSLAQRIAQGVDRLNGIVSDVLAFAGEMRPQTKSTPIAAVTASAVDLARGRFDAVGARLDCRVGAEIAAEVDASLMARAIGNLLFNAADAAGEGEVRLTAEQTAETVILDVSDSGPGVDAEAMDRIFNPFFTTKDAGTGLGLAIVHRIVESHGGSVHVTNARPPEGLGGARFRVVLPRRGDGDAQPSTGATQCAE